MRPTFQHLEAKKVLQERMDQVWTAQESNHKMPAWLGLKRKQRANKKYSLQESYCSGVLAESRKELAGVGVEGGEKERIKKKKLIGHTTAFCILTEMIH